MLCSASSWAFLSSGSVMCCRSSVATIPGALRHAVERWGPNDFIVTPARRMTYAEADTASARLARRMLAAGMGKGTRVGLFFTYGQEWVIAWLAASRIGALERAVSEMSAEDNQPAADVTPLRRAKGPNPAGG